MTRVIVAANRQVAANGTIHLPGELVEVDDAMAEQWTKLGYVQVAPAARPRRGQH